MNSERDYESLSFHDNHVHGLSIQEGKHGQGELILDIDHIVEWLCAEGGAYSFKVAPAFLIFHEISELTISLDYKGTSAAITPFSIQALHRQEFSYPNGFKSFQWHIELNWPNGEISFMGQDFSLQLRAEPAMSDGQFLTAMRRQAMLTDHKSFKADA